MLLAKSLSRALMDRLEVTAKLKQLMRQCKCMCIGVQNWCTGELGAIIVVHAVSAILANNEQSLQYHSSLKTRNVVPFLIYIILYLLFNISTTTGVL